MALAKLLAVLDTTTLETLREKLLTTSVAVSSLPNGLQDVQKLADALLVAEDQELQTLVADITRVVKALSRVAIKCIAAATANPNNVAKILALDDNLLPILRVSKAFVDRSSHREQEDGKELSRWLPFVLTACYFMDGAELPGAEWMQSAAVVEEILDAAVKLAKAGNRQSLVARYVAQITALCSQDMDKEEWVAVASVNKKIMLRVVEQVSFPYLGGDLLGRLLALTLPLVDDLTDATQLVGARLLRHIVKNVTPTELRWYADVLLEVLYTAIVTRKPDALDVLLDCLAELLDKVSPPGEFKHYDRFMPRLLSDTSLCSDVTVRVVFVRYLRVLVVRQGAPHSLNIIRYMQSLLKVLVAGFESVNVELLVTTLETLQATVLAAWPRIAPHTEQLLVGVLRAVAFCELFNEVAEFTPSAKEKEHILALCEDVLDLLHEVNAGNAVVSDMLSVVSRQSPQMSAFCDRVQAKLTSR